MIVFAFIRCWRIEKIRHNGFDATEDSVIARHMTGQDGILCSDDPECQLKGVYEYHTSLALDIPGDVLNEYSVSSAVSNDTGSEFSAHVGWVLPADVATEHLYKGGLGIDKLVSYGVASLGELYESDRDHGQFTEIAQVLQQRERARLATRAFKSGGEADAEIGGEDPTLMTLMADFSKLQEHHSKAWVGYEDSKSRQDAAERHDDFTPNAEHSAAQRQWCEAYNAMHEAMDRLHVYVVRECRVGQ